MSNGGQAVAETIALTDMAATRALGQRIAERIRMGDVVALSGGLGAGKTTLAREIIAALGHRGDVPSPSFAILQLYDGPDLRVPVLHADFYRIDDEREVDELGLEHYRDEAAMIAEWPENVGGFAHETTCLSVALEHGDGARRAIVRGHADWLERW